MSRLDELVVDLRNGRSSRRQLMKRAAALGIAAPALAAGGTLRASAQDDRNSVVWVSPRGTLEVLDDYPYWVGKEMGYFGDLETELLPAILEATSSTKAVAEGQADMAYPSPGVFSLGVEAGIDLVSVWQMGAYDVFDIALPKGSEITDLQQLEGKTIVLGDAGWSAITDPMLAQAGVDISTINYVAAGPSWGQTLAQGQADAALCWEGLRAQWSAVGLDFDYILGQNFSRFPANSFVIRREDAEDEALADLYTQYLQGWAKGMEFGWQNPRAATQITMNVPEIRDALRATFPDPEIAVGSMWQLAVVYRGDWATREGWGWHDLDAWNFFLDTITDIGQLSEDIEAEEIVFNTFVADANAFDHSEVENDAMNYELSSEFEAVTPPGGPSATPGA
jgi:NitT/TauT family transport system substrate-binding protein